MLKTNAIGILPYANFMQSKKSSSLTSQLSFRGIEDYEPEAQKFYGDKGEYLSLTDKRGIFNVENISDSKVGTKFILTPTASEYRGLRILVSPDTKITSKRKDTMAGVVSPNISFKGTVYGSIRSEKDSTDEVMEKSYTDFFTSGNADEIAKKSTPLEKDYNFYVPSDGDGTRYRDITKLLGGVTKPASKIPARLNGEDVKLVQVVLSNFAKTGRMDKFEPVYTEPANGSAYALLEALVSGQIKTDKPIVFCWGDNFSDIDVKALINYHDENDSDFTMLTLPINTDDTSRIGVAKVDSIDNPVVKDFKEKPDSSIVQNYVIPDTEDSYLGVVGPYVISPKALNKIREEYLADKESFKDAKGKFDFSAGIIERLAHDNNIKVMAYLKPKTSDWSDLGTGKDFRAEMKRVKEGAYSNLPKEIRETISKNVDKNGNISFDPLSKAVFESFCHENKLEISNAVAYYDNI